MKRVTLHRALGAIMALVFVGTVLVRARSEEAPGPLEGSPANGTRPSSAATPDERPSAVEQRTAALEGEVAKLRAEIRRIAATRAGEKDYSAQFVDSLLASTYPNPAPLYEGEQVSRYSVKQPDAKRLPPPPSLKRRREGIKSFSSLPRPGGEIEQKPRKTSKGEMIDVYFRTSGGEATMTEVVNALRRLDEDIRFSQNGDQLLVRATRAGQEVVRQLIHYYEEQMNAAE